VIPGVPGYEPREELPAGPSDEEKLRRHREEQFTKLGFTAPQAVVLSRSKDAKGFYLYWGDVKNLLDQGCDDLIGFDIFSDGE